MGAVTSRPVIHTIETGLMAIARLVDVLVRMIDRVFSTIVSKCLSPALYAHFYVTPPVSAETAVEVGPNGLTRVCTDDGVCYIPATRAKQHRNWRKRNQEDRLKERMMRAEWAAAGLDVRQMQKAERERQRQKSSSNPILAFKQLSRATTMDDGLADDVAMASKRTSIDDTASVRRTKRSIVDLAAEDREKDSEVVAKVSTLSYNPARHTVTLPQQSLRTLAAVREASHDHGATLPQQEKDAISSGGVDDQSSMPNSAASSNAQIPSKHHKRGMSAPIFGLVKPKAAVSIEATTASRLVPDGASTSFSMIQRCDSPVSASAQQGDPLLASSRPTSVVQTSASPMLVQPRPRRPIRAAFDVANIASNAAPFTVDLTPAGASRSSSTPPIVAPGMLPTRSRTSFDISPAHTPFGFRAGSPAIDDDASSIRSRRSLFTAHAISLPRSTTPNTPPPYVIQLADRACKSRWESSAKERKQWKDEVKRLALNKVHEQHAAYRASLDLKGSSTPPISSASTTHLPA